LKDMCAKLPTTSEEFLKVSGVGEHKLQKYGLDFIQTIRSYCEANPDRQSELGAPSPSKKQPKKAVTDSHLETFQLHQQNLSLYEIASKRELALSTVENHLIQCAQQGMDVDFTKLIPEEVIPLLEKAVAEIGRDRLKPIKEQLPEEVSYFMIKGYVYFLSKKIKSTYRED
jgi:ATP-dependent DNA helicase RecQ